MSYDSWGKLILIDGTLKDTVGVKNPYRYRGYRYDTETGLYYLQSRYYNPEWGRFINNDSIAGSVGELLGHNIFAYCKNSPVNSSDPSGFRETRGAINPDGDYDGVGKKAYKKVTETTVGKKARAIKSAAMQNIKHPYKKAKSIMNKSGTSIAIHDAVVNDGIAAMTFAITSELHISDKAALGISLGIGIVQGAINGVTHGNYDAVIITPNVVTSNITNYVYGDVLERFDNATLDPNAFKNLNKYDNRCHALDIDAIRLMFRHGPFSFFEFGG